MIVLRIVAAMIALAALSACTGDGSLPVRRSPCGTYAPCASPPHPTSPI